jgi:hypothetical protein
MLMQIMMMLLQLHVVKDDVIDDEEKNYDDLYICQSMFQMLMILLPSLSLLMMLYYRIPFLLRESVEILSL